MAQTVDTSPSGLLPAAQVFTRCDVRVLANLCSDTGSRLGSPTDVALMKTALIANANFLALRDDAVGMIEQALAVGGRYSVADIAALLAAGGAGAAAYYRMASRIVVTLAYERRPDMVMEQPWIAEAAETAIQQLRDGERLYPLLESEEAGRIDTTTETAFDVEARAGIVVSMERYFGRRLNRQ